MTPSGTPRQLHATVAVHRKHYADEQRCAAAAAHLAFLTLALTGCPGPTRLPALISIGPQDLITEHLPGRHPLPRDTPAVAAALGHLDAATHRAGLTDADLTRPAHVRNLTIPAFTTGRTEALHRVPLTLEDRPVTVYKDANLRNFLLDTPDTDPHGAGPAVVGVVDFDDLTLAPFGYDLAKLVVSTAMAHGPLDEERAHDALDAYNAAVTSHADIGASPACTEGDLAHYCEIHAQLTSRYLGRHGYAHAWDDARPWPHP